MELTFWGNQGHSKNTKLNPVVSFRQTLPDCIAQAGNPPCADESGEICRRFWRIVIGILSKIDYGKTERFLVVYCN